MKFKKFMRENWIIIVLVIMLCLTVTGIVWYLHTQLGINKVQDVVYTVTGQRDDDDEPETEAEKEIRSAQEKLEDKEVSDIMDKTQAEVDKAAEQEAEAVNATPTPEPTEKASAKPKSTKKPKATKKPKSKVKMTKGQKALIKQNQ